MSRVNDVFGCDIGNGFGYISILKDAKNDPLTMFPAYYHLDKVGMPTDAYVFPPNGEKIEIFNKKPAISIYKKEPEKFVHAVKRQMRNEYIEVDGINSPVSVDKIYASVTRDLILLGNEERKNRGEEPVYEIVFTYPASFEKNVFLLNRMQKCIEDIIIDDHHIKVVGRIPEPAATAIDYLFYLQNVAPDNIRITRDSYTSLVYDLGHGTFDVAVVTARSKGEPYQLFVSDGLDDIGGINFDDILYDEICRLLKEKAGYTPKNKNDRKQIRDFAVSIKHELSEPDCLVVDKAISLRGMMEPVSIELSRERFEFLSKNLINRTLELVNIVLEQAESKNIHIDAVVLSGGASQMPMVKNALSKLVEDINIPIYSWRPSEAVSFGAARYAYERGIDEDPDTSLLEKYSEYSYGILMPPKDNELKGTVKVLIKSNNKLPAESESVFFRTNSDRLTVRLFRSKVKNDNKDNLDFEKQCDSIMFRTFDVPTSSDCNVRIEVLEDCNIKVKCKLNNGTTLEQSTKDSYIRKE